jgi:hypothetical protein
MQGIWAENLAFSTARNLGGNSVLGQFEFG